MASSLVFELQRELKGIFIVRADDERMTIWLLSLLPWINFKLTAGKLGIDDLFETHNDAHHFPPGACR